jgi:hypothetical protein
VIHPLDQSHDWSEVHANGVTWCHPYGYACLVCHIYICKLCPPNQNPHLDFATQPCWRKLWATAGGDERDAAEKPRRLGAETLSLSPRKRARRNEH